MKRVFGDICVLQRISYSLLIAFCYRQMPLPNRKGARPPDQGADTCVRRVTAKRPAVRGRASLGLAANVAVSLAVNDFQIGGSGHVHGSGVGCCDLASSAIYLPVLSQSCRLEPRSFRTRSGS